MNPAFTWVLTLVTSTSIAILAATAHAQPSEPPAAAPAPTRVAIVLVGSAGRDGSLAERIRSWFGPDVSLSITRDQTLAVERVLGPLPVGVGVWVTLRGPTQARLYFAAAGEAEEPTRYLVRDVPLNDDLDEIGSERVAQVVHSSVTALITDSIEATPRPEIEREIAPSPAPESEPEPKSKPVAAPRAAVAPERAGGPTPAVFAGAFYRGAFAGDEGFAHGPGLALGASLDFGRFATGVVARGHYAWPHTERWGDLAVTLSELAARVGARGALGVGNFEVDLELGGGSAWVRYDPEAAPAGPSPGPRATDQRLFGFVSTGIRRKLGPIQAGARVELEFYPSLSSYELDTGRQVASSSHYRPALVLEVVFD